MADRPDSAEEAGQRTCQARAREEAGQDAWLQGGQRQRQREREMTFSCSTSFLCEHSITLLLYDTCHAEDNNVDANCMFSCVGIIALLRNIVLLHTEVSRTGDSFADFITNAAGFVCMRNCSRTSKTTLILSLRRKNVKTVFHRQVLCSKPESNVRIIGQ